MNTNISRSILTNFGSLNYHEPIYFNKFNIDIGYFSNKKDKFTYFENLCDTILNNNVEKFNNNIIINLVHDVVDNYFIDVCDVIFDIFSKTTINIHDVIDNEICNNTFNLNSFKNLHKQYSANVECLKNMINYCNANMTYTDLTDLYRVI